MMHPSSMMAHLQTNQPAGLAHPLVSHSTPRSPTACNANIGQWTCDVCKCPCARLDTLSKHQKGTCWRSRCHCCGDRSRSMQENSQHIQREHGQGRGIAICLVCLEHADRGDSALLEQHSCGYQWYFDSRQDRERDREREIWGCPLCIGSHENATTTVYCLGPDRKKDLSRDAAKDLLREEVKDLTLYELTHRKLRGLLRTSSRFAPGVARHIDDRNVNLEELQFPLPKMQMWIEQLEFWYNTNPADRNRLPIDPEIAADAMISQIISSGRLRFVRPSNQSSTAGVPIAGPSTLPQAAAPQWTSFTQIPSNSTAQLDLSNNVEADICQLWDSSDVPLPYGAPGATAYGMSDFPGVNVPTWPRGLPDDLEPLPSQSPTYQPMGCNMPEGSMLFDDFPELSIEGPSQTPDLRAGNLITQQGIDGHGPSSQSLNTVLDWTPESLALSSQDHRSEASCPDQRLTGERGSYVYRAKGKGKAPLMRL